MQLNCPILQPLEAANKCRKDGCSVFYSQIKKVVVDIYILEQKLEIVNSFKYLDFIWTNKSSLKPTVNRCLENIQRSVCQQLKWLRSSKTLPRNVLRNVSLPIFSPILLGFFPSSSFSLQTQNRQFFSTEQDKAG